MSTKIISAYFWLCNMYASFSIKGFGLLKMLINGWTKWLSGSAFGEKQTERWKSKTEGWLGRVIEWVSEREREREREREKKNSCWFCALFCLTSIMVIDELFLLTWILVRQWIELRCWVYSTRMRSVSKLEYILRVPRREVKRGVVSEKRLIHAYFIKSSDLSNFEKA